MENVISDYTGIRDNDGEGKEIEVSEREEAGEVRMAVPKTYDYRERFKRHELRSSDVVAKPVVHKLRNDNVEFDQIDRIVGRGTFFGPGTEIDI
jgi:hypothetical protein